MQTMNLTPKQAELIRIGREKGFITLLDAIKVYSDEKSRRNALDRLEILGLIAPTESINKFRIVMENLEDGE